jgi:hypothetical protein
LARLSWLALARHGEEPVAMSERISLNKMAAGEAERLILSTSVHSVAYA